MELPIKLIDLIEQLSRRNRVEVYQINAIDIRNNDTIEQLLPYTITVSGIDGAKIIPTFSKLIPINDSLFYNTVQYIIQYIEQWQRPLTMAEKQEYPGIGDREQLILSPSLVMVRPPEIIPPDESDQSLVSTLENPMTTLSSVYSPDTSSELWVVAHKCVDVLDPSLVDRLNSMTTQDMNVRMSDYPLSCSLREIIMYMEAIGTTRFLFFNVGAIEVNADNDTEYVASILEGEEESYFVYDKTTDSIVDHDGRLSVEVLMRLFFRPRIIDTSILNHYVTGLSNDIQMDRWIVDTRYRPAQFFLPIGYECSPGNQHTVSSEQGYTFVTEGDIINVNGKDNLQLVIYPSGYFDQHIGWQLDLLEGLLELEERGIDINRQPIPIYSYYRDKLISDNQRNNKGVSGMLDLLWYLMMTIDLEELEAPYDMKPTINH